MWGEITAGNRQIFRNLEFESDFWSYPVSNYGENRPFPQDMGQHSAWHRHCLNKGNSTGAIALRTKPGEGCSRKNADPRK